MDIKRSLLGIWLRVFVHNLKAQSDMRSDLEGKISEVKSSVTAVEGIVRKVSFLSH